VLLYKSVFVSREDISFNLASFMLCHSSLFGFLRNQKVVLMYALQDSQDYSYDWIKLLSGGTTKVVDDDNSGQFRVDVLIFESGITYISADHDTLQWMFRGDLYNFPKIQFIVLLAPTSTNDKNLQYLDDKLNEAIESVMSVFSCANQILLSRHFSINMYLNVVTEENTTKFIQDRHGRDLDDLNNAIHDWYKKNALSIDRMQKLPDPDFIFNLTRVTGFVTLTSKLIEKEVLENKLLSLKNNNSYNLIQAGMIDCIDKQTTSNETEVLVDLNTMIDR
jgi:hypothetical protein